MPACMASGIEILSSWMQVSVTVQSCTLKCFQRSHSFSLLITETKSYWRKCKELSRSPFVLMGQIGDRRHHLKADTQICIHTISQERK